ncbi:MAG: glycoside hydrolase family 15 protein [Pseudonocardiaceae bacterium]
MTGWAGSTPIRVGNAAKDQVQYDGMGLLVEAVSVYLQTGGRLDGGTWRLVRELADRVAAEDARQPQLSHGIWELREPALLVDGDIGRWLVLDRAIKLGRWRRPRRSRRRRTAARDVIAARVRALLGVVLGLLWSEVECAGQLTRRTIDALDAYPFLYRYPPDALDGLGGWQGAFVPVSFWAVSAQALPGDLPGAVARMDALCTVLPRLLPEEIDPVPS